MLSVLVFRISGYLYLRGKGSRASKRGVRTGRARVIFIRGGYVSTFETGKSMKTIACNGSIFLYVTYT